MEQNEILAENPDPDSRIFGLTGGIGSGKTTVAKILENMGFSIYYSDARAKDLVNESAYLKSEIIKLLGEDAYNKDGLYNRKYVANIVFTNPGKLDVLNSIIHPAVKSDFKNWLQNREDKEIIFKETALLFELDLDKECHQSVLVTAEDNARSKRVMDRDGKTYREVLNIMNKQMPEKEKIKRADFVIYNNGTLEDLQNEVEKVKSEIMALQF
ncbi:dephospho-CoA kinase [Frigoriflavimonas asaccharolytica]|uniref:Dephospho-CoA kinase n=1 Tax=Frigoriflavimonas asaccharolytica TaxID=2735899 RepID=A0A8J8GDL9_9FLAO|nr:dephospho-CoA kinase [Frigoriflavimonas asaccharolytica]NRS93862.1 dephospho-CoA kinase [Frigoriflavimonas asaccharolytica]